MAPVISPIELWPSLYQNTACAVVAVKDGSRSRGFRCVIRAIFLRNPIA